jgi:ADP-glucose pyrophosphorylase
MDIGRITSYLKVHSFLLDKQNKKNHIGSNCQNNGELIKSVLGSNVNIGKNTEIKNSVILNNATIEGNCHLDNCVIGENAIIKQQSSLRYVVVGDNESLSEQTNEENKAVWTQSIPEGYPKKQIGNVIAE